MNSISKCQKSSQKVNYRQLRKNFDGKITDLPSSLKAKILSCLPTKDAVKTSILSRKWTRSWTSVTNLDFDDNLIGLSRDGDHEDIISGDDFVLFVNRVLLLRERSSLQRFRMRCSGCYKGSLVNTWIAAVLLCHVQEFDLFVPLEHPSLLTSDIFTCKSLTVLKLDVDGHVYMPVSVCLPNLKTLHLANVELLDDVSISNLLSGCPVLEELILRQCVGDDVSVVNVIAPALTNLTLEFLPCDDKRDDGDYRYEVVLDTPALKFLNLSDYDDSKGYALKNLNNLIKAVITVGAPYGAPLMDESFEIRSRAMIDLLNGISQVQVLVLSDESMQAIHLYDPALPTYNNLTSLELSTTRYAGWRYLLKLLMNSPCLETLYLHRKETRYDDDDDYLSSDEVPSCFLSHLKVIKIYNFEGIADDMEMAEYFLENANVLEKLTLDYQPTAFYDSPISFDMGENTWEKDNFYKKLLMLRRASNVCKVEVL